MTATTQTPQMMTLADVVATDGTKLSDLTHDGRYVLVWWHPQALSPLACRSCAGAAGAEPINLITEIYAAGCDIVGLTYDRPERVQRYLSDIGIEYPILSVTEDAARAHGVAKVESEAWQSIPHRIAFLADAHLQVINRYEVHDPTVFLRSVRNSVKSGPPESMWEPPAKKTFLQRLLGR